MKHEKRSTKSRNLIRTQAESLLRDPLFLHRAKETIGEQGVTGEEKNRLILFVAGVTKDLDRPVSVLVKGPSSSGKSKLVRDVLRLFPPEAVVLRASLSKMAPVHSADPLGGKILYVQEYRGSKDAQYLIRLQQSEGIIAHEFTTVRGPHRGTGVSERSGVPVVITTTTADQVFEDDETRFLSISTDESPQQTLAVLEAEIDRPTTTKAPNLTVWNEAMRLVAKRKVSFSLPSWFRFVAHRLPQGQVRMRRDWVRFLIFCKAIALLRSFASDSKSPKDVRVCFADYCTAYEILKNALEFSVTGVHERETDLKGAVEELHKRLGRAVAVNEVASELGWKNSHVYKFTLRAIRHGLLRYEQGIRPNNQKRLLPVLTPSKSLLPSPRTVFEENAEIGKTAVYLNPLTGKNVRFERSPVPRWKTETRRYL